MKRSSFYVFAMGFIATMIYGCSGKTASGTAADVSMDEIDSIAQNPADTIVTDTLPADDNSACVNKGYTDSIDAANPSRRFRSALWGNTSGDTVVYGMKVSYECFETRNPEDYVIQQCNLLTSSGEYVKEEWITYGNRAKIIFAPASGASIGSDTIEITRQMLVDSLNRDPEIYRNERYILSHLRLNDVRNDSIIFSFSFYMYDTDGGNGIYLMFPKDNPVANMKIANDFDLFDTDDEWDDDYEY